MPRVDVEQVRTAAEHDAARILARYDGWPRTPYVPQQRDVARRNLMSNALRLTDTMAPELYATARDAMAALGVEDEIELFQSRGFGAANANLVLHGRPIGVELIGGYLTDLDRGAQLAVFGHEIGHALAHHGNPAFAWAYAASGDVSSPVRRAYRLAAELTADRFGLLACRDLRSALHLEMRSAAGPAAPGLRFDTDAYLAQCREVAEQLLASNTTASGTTHPEHSIRGYAEWLFSETDVYASITGCGPASRSIDAVNDELTRLLGIRALAADTVPEAIELATEGARSGFEAAGAAFAAVVRAVSPSLRRIADVARAEFGTPAADAPDDAPTEAPPEIDDAERALLARFEALERLPRKR